eukprot:GDKJ01016984.1.p1 GENE.GDKJ01016984.1~~GDKJ01016984.1.p1  ORF type:complete len:1084 (+),score=279.93 GDKJ01016984.1:141-3392(+)
MFKVFDHVFDMFRSQNQKFSSGATEKELKDIGVLSDLLNELKNSFSEIEDSVRVIKTCRDEIDSRTEILSLRTNKLSREKKIIEQTQETMKNRISNIQASESVSSRLRSAKWSDLLSLKHTTPSLNHFLTQSVLRQVETALYPSSLLQNFNSQKQQVFPYNASGVGVWSPLLESMTTARNSEGCLVIREPLGFIPYDKNSASSDAKSKLFTSNSSNSGSNNSCDFFEHRCEFLEMLQKLDASISFLSSSPASSSAKNEALQLRRVAVSSFIRVVHSTLQLADQQAKQAMELPPSSPSSPSPMAKLLTIHERLLTTLSPLRPGLLSLSSRWSISTLARVEDAVECYDTALEKIETMYCAMRFRYTAALLKKALEDTNKLKINSFANNSNENLGKSKDSTNVSISGIALLKVRSMIESCMHSVNLEIDAFKFLFGQRKGDSTIRKEVAQLMQLTIDAQKSLLSSPHSTSLDAHNPLLSSSSNLASGASAESQLSTLIEISEFFNSELLEPNGMVYSRSQSDRRHSHSPANDRNRLVLPPPVESLNLILLSGIADFNKNFISHHILELNQSIMSSKFTKFQHPGIEFSNGIYPWCLIPPGVSLPSVIGFAPSPFPPLSLMHPPSASHPLIWHPLQGVSPVLELIPSTLGALQSALSDEDFKAVTANCMGQVLAIIQNFGEAIEKSPPSHKLLKDSVNSSSRLCLEPRLHRRLFEIKHLLLLRRAVSNLDTSVAKTRVRLDHISANSRTFWHQIFGERAANLLSSSLLSLISSSLFFKKKETSNVVASLPPQALLESSLKISCESLVEFLTMGLLGPLVHLTSTANSIALRMKKKQSGEKEQSNVPESSAQITQEELDTLKKDIDEFYRLLIVDIPQLLFMCRLYVEPDMCLPHHVLFTRPHATTSKLSNSRSAREVAAEERDPSSSPANLDSHTNRRKTSQMTGEGVSRLLSDEGEGLRSASLNDNDMDLAGSVFDGDASGGPSSCASQQMKKRKKGGGVLWLLKPVSQTLADMIKQLGRLLLVDLFLTEKQLIDIGWTSKVERANNLVVGLVDSVRSLKCELNVTVVNNSSSSVEVMNKEDNSKV